MQNEDVDDSNVDTGPINYYKPSAAMLKKQPFPKVPSLIGVASILAYYGYKDEIRVLLG